MANPAQVTEQVRFALAQLPARNDGDPLVSPQSRPGIRHAISISALRAANVSCSLVRTPTCRTAAHEEGTQDENRRAFMSKSKSDPAVVTASALVRNVG